MAYDIKIADVDAVGDGCETYHTELNDALEGVQKALSDLVTLASFQGRAAESAKLYFQEVHGPILSGILYLVKQIASDYAEYNNGFTASPVCEDAEARLPNDAMDAARNKLSTTFATDGLGSIDTLLASAQSTMGSVVSLSVPSTVDARTALEHRSKKVEEVRTAIQDLEDSCVGRLNDVDGFDSLVASVGAAITHYAAGSISIGSYQQGSFSSSALGQKMLGDMGRAVEYQQTKREAVMEASAGRHQREEERLVRERERLQDQRTGWRVLGLVAVVAGAVATVATLGAAAPLAAAITTVGLVGTGLDIADRVSELAGDEEDTLGFGPASDYFDGASKGIKHAQLPVGIYAEDWEMADDGLKSVKKSVYSKSAEVMTDVMGGDEADAEFAGTMTGAGYDIYDALKPEQKVEGLVQNTVEGTTKASKISKWGDVASAGADIVAGVSDYAESKVNEKISSVEQDMRGNREAYANYAALW